MFYYIKLIKTINIIVPFGNTRSEKKNLTSIDIYNKSVALYLLLLVVLPTISDFRLQRMHMYIGKPLESQTKRYGSKFTGCSAGHSINSNCHFILKKKKKTKKNCFSS